MSDDMLPMDALERLSRQEGVDVRPTLLRVLTDLFVQKPHHTQDELDRYQTVALDLLDVVPVETRVVVAAKLAGDSRTPPAVVSKLLEDDRSVAAAILARFPDAPRAALISAALDGGAVEAAAVASRPDLDADMARILAHHPDDVVAETLVANTAIVPPEATVAALVSRAEERPALAAALLRRTDYDAAALAPLYLAAGPDRRAAIRAALAARPSRSAVASRPLRDPESVDGALVQAAAEAGRGDLIVEAVGAALGLKPADAAWLAVEPSGEAFVMMLRAANVDGDQTARAILLAQPEIARSSGRFFDLVAIAEETPRSVAADIVAALVGETGRAQAARREPMFDPSGAPERAGARAARSRPHVRGLERDRQRG